MKTKVLILSLVTSTLMNVTSGLAKNFKNAKQMQSSKDKKVEFYPVKYTKTKNKNKDCMDYNGACLMQLSKKPVVVLENFMYQAFVNNKAGIKLYLDDRTSKDLQKATKKYLNTNLALVMDGKVVNVPSVKEIIKTNAFDISFKNPKGMETILDGLSND
ncbi:MAG: hypothetical protein ISR65_20225 [Bacteriovoracaceae bacterium]|nr:hypothetical protein [Bacteriovoracaceae bacterium]